MTSRLEGWPRQAPATPLVVQNPAFSSSSISPHWIGITSWSPASLTVDGTWVRFAEPGFVLDVDGNVLVNGALGRLEIGGNAPVNTWGENMLVSEGAAPEMRVGGNFELANGATFSVFGTATNPPAVTVGARVDVTGDIILGAKSKVFVHSHHTNGGILTISAAFESETPLHRIQIECEDFTLASGASVNITERGHAGKAKADGFGPGKGSNPLRQGAGHGGQGLFFNGLHQYGRAYGDPIQPTLPGSGGGAHWTSRGGHGGGAIRIAATGHVQIDGTVNAKGGDAIPNGELYSGAGSGGSVYIQSETFSGASSGLVDVSGGSSPHFSVGAGGRIAIHYDVAEQALLPVPEVVFRAKSGNVLRADAMGSLYLSDGSWVAAPFTCFEGVWFHGAWATTWTFAGDFTPINSIGFGQPSTLVSVAGDVILDNVCLGLSGGSELSCDNLALINGGSMSVLSAPVPVPGTATTTTQHGSLVDASGTISLAAGSWVYPLSIFKPYSGISNTNGMAALFKAAHVTIATNAGFHADGFGHPGGSYNWNVWGNGNGNGSGRGYGSRDFYGASHGGLGSSAVEARRYGSAFAPVFPGSGGGSGYRATAGSGGGAIRIQASGVVELNGMLTADASGDSGDAKGSSGGSIFVLAGSFRGGSSAVMKAKGSAGSYQTHHGGGGRIAVGIGLTEDEIDGLFTGASHGRLIVSTNDVKYAGTSNVDAGGATAQPGTIQFMTIRRGTAILIR